MRAVSERRLSKRLFRGLPRGFFSDRSGARGLPGGFFSGWGGTRSLPGGLFGGGVRVAPVRHGLGRRGGLDGSARGGARASIGSRRRRTGAVHRLDLAEKLLAFHLGHLAPPHHVLNEVTGALDRESGEAGGGADDVLHGCSDLTAGLLADLVGSRGELGHGLPRVHATMGPSRCRRRRRDRSGVFTFGSGTLTLLNHGRECSSCRGSEPSPTIELNEPTGYVRPRGRPGWRKYRFFLVVTQAGPASLSAGGLGAAKCRKAWKPTCITTVREQ